MKMNVLFIQEDIHTKEKNRALTGKYAKDINR